MLKVMILAGEASGDMHGANLARALQELEPEVRLLGMGSSLMQDAGVELAFDVTELSTVGFAEAIKSIGTLKGILRQLGELMDREKPNVLVLIDYPGFNMEVAKVAKSKNIPLVYYFSPTAWAWGKGRAKKVASLVTKVASVLPFEADVYREAGADVVFVGHPLLDIVRPQLSQEQFCKLWSLDQERPIVGLLPGSRKQEIKSLLPVLLESAKLIKEQIPQVQFLLPLAHTISREEVEEQVKANSLEIKVIEGQTYELMTASDIIVVASGTATLEAACLGVPMVIVYQVSFSTWLLGKILLKIPHIGMPNIIAGKEIVPELIQKDANPEKISEKVISLLEKPEKIIEIKRELEKVREKLGGEGAVKRVAQLVLDLGRVE